MAPTRLNMCGAAMVGVGSSSFLAALGSRSAVLQLLLLRPALSRRRSPLVQFGICGRTTPWSSWKS